MARVLRGSWDLVIQLCVLELGLYVLISRVTLFISLVTESHEPLSKHSGIHYPDPREDLESSSPNLRPYTTKGTLKEPPIRDLIFGSSRGSG